MLAVFRWLALIAAIVLVFAIAGMIVSRSSSPPPSQQEQTAEHGNEHANKEDTKTLWDSWFPDSLSLYTLALVVFTAVLAFVTVSA
jgi:nucleoside permease NupC